MDHLEAELAAERERNAKLALIIEESDALLRDPCCRECASSWAHKAKEKLAAILAPKEGADE